MIPVELESREIKAIGKGDRGSVGPVGVHGE